MRGYEMENNSMAVNTKMHRRTYCCWCTGAVQGWRFNAHFISRKTALMALPIIAYMYYVSCKHNTPNHFNRDFTSWKNAIALPLILSYITVRHSTQNKDSPWWIKISKLLCHMLCGWRLDIGNDGSRLTWEASLLEKLTNMGTFRHSKYWTIHTVALLPL